MRSMVEGAHSTEASELANGCRYVQVHHESITSTGCPMANVWKSVASLRFCGDNLSADEVTGVLGGDPHERATKGELLGSERAALTGTWLRRAPDQIPGNVDVQITELFAGLTEDPAKWLELSTRFRADIFVGLFLNQPNEGLELSPKTLGQIAARGLTLSLDIYSGNDDLEK